MDKKLNSELRCDELFTICLQLKFGKEFYDDSIHDCIITLNVLKKAQKNIEKKFIKAQQMYKEKFGKEINLKGF